MLELSNIAAPQLIASSINQLVAGKNLNEIIIALVSGYALVTVLAFIVSELRGRALVSLDVKIRFGWFDKVISHLVRLPESYFQTRAAGETLSKLQSINTISHFYSGSLVEVALNGFFAICIVVAMCALNPGFGLIWAVCSTLYIVIRSRLQPRVEGATREAAIATAKQEGHLFETVQVLRTLRSFGVLDKRMKTWRGMLGLQSKADAEMQEQIFHFRAVSTFLFGASRLAVLCYGVWIFTRGASAIGSVVAALAYMDGANGRVATLVDTYFGIKAMHVHTDRVAEITDEPAVPERPLLREVDQDALAVRLENVSFRYGAFDEWVIKDLSLDIRHGDLVLLTGESGIGKSTLIKLIAGVLTPVEGRVYVYGNDISCYEVHPEVCASVFQDDHLLSGSIRNNVSPGEAEINNDERVWSALLQSGLSDFIRSLPMNLETTISELGASLSGGQAQRLSLARALYANPKLLLLDEATSNLDEANETHVMSSILAIRGTKLFASHSKQLEQYADVVLRLERSGEVSARHLVKVDESAVSRPSKLVEVLYRTVG
ncbi:hypothetical protein GCM10011408_05690 [Dyella caseinilytica]|nr:hypothetical protein GCM10011408_05690 [Dyella caseinilytica]